ncbi:MULTISPECIES: hypothetical protein [Pseudomonas]|uniref:Uncharacterized protein n=1 Tax=Pseudomonas gessardii TaxID=78544 RepID=A0A7Y1MM92_9PSED|nr:MULTISPECIES: hypothetical protein [Pseudomonas]MBH3423187.1 hypothetical protein [Pseudomonas gessardii]MCF4978050.1 hypothetical protein [Pseudomonas gessardii]MCF4989032.1 hypothetical protein [Pseudomonas gessardii]MCF5084249.1 hypothetical protein [Pseudomonas gessardii]MCF5093477.1 hypothetical protein [Pseudomonas gessardii]
MSDSTISSRNLNPAFWQREGADSKMTKEEAEKATGMKFMTYSEMAGGKKPEAETGSASGGVQASAGVGDVSFSAGNSASISF